MDSSRPRQKRTRIACKPCRQNKIRCGMRTPPCARCSRLDIECTVEPHFRRSNQRDRMRQLESHVEELHQTLMDTVNSDTAVPPSRLANPESSLDTGSKCPERYTAEPVRDEINTYRIGPVVLDKVQADRLHSIFFSKHHPILPFLNDKFYAAERYRTCPLLFWSIVAVGARHYDSDTNLLSKLTPSLDEWLHKTVLSGLVSVAQVQAVVLLGHWPLPNYRFLTNKSLLYANVALMSAMQLGLHRPGYEQEYTSKRTLLSSHTVSERSKTWIATVMLSYSITTYLGLPLTTPMMDDMALQSLLDTPQCLQHTLLIHNCSHTTISSLLGNIQPKHEFHARLDSLDKNFDTLEASMQQKLSFTNALRLASARLYLQCMYFIPPEETCSPPEELSLKQHRKDGVLKAYTTATSLITIAISHDDSLDELPYVPVEILRMIFTAALVVFRVIHSSFAADLDLGPISESGRTLCSMACFAINRCGLQYGDDKNKDLAARMVNKLRSLWRSAEEDTQLKSQEPVIKFRSRMGAGVVLDCLNIWRSRYRKSGAQQPDPQTQTNIEPDISVHNLADPIVSSQDAFPSFVELDSLSLTESGEWDSLGWNLPGSFEQGPEDWNLNGYM